MQFQTKGWPQIVQKSPFWLIKALGFMHLLQTGAYPSLSLNGLAQTFNAATLISSYQSTGILRAYNLSYPNQAVLKASNFVAI